MHQDSIGWVTTEAGSRASLPHEETRCTGAAELSAAVRVEFCQVLSTSISIRKRRRKFSVHLV